MATLATRSGRLRLPGAASRLGRWVTLHLQERRRARRTSPAAPVITGGEREWDETQVGWADALIDWAFDHGTYPVATLEIWLARDSSDWEFELVTAVPSWTWGYRHSCVSQIEETLLYKMRYRDGSIIGPFSNEREVVTAHY